MSLPWGSATRWVAAVLCFLAASGAAKAARVFDADVPSIVSHNDVVYLSPARQGWEGLPLGNGALGAMVWQPEELIFQLNTPLSGVYGGAICRLRLGTLPGTMVGMASYRQQLSLHTATLTTEVVSDSGKVRMTSFMPADTDALVVQVEDTREDVKERSAEVETWRKSASVSTEDNLILVTDILKHAGEPDYRFAVAVDLETEKDGAAAVGSKLTTTSRKFTVWLAFAATREKDVDVTASAKEKLTALWARGVEKVRQRHDEWWAAFWKKSFIKLDSEDGVADYVANLWYMHVYAMGAGSRGEVPPKFNGGLWTDNYDEREWGPAYWHWNTQETYWPLYAANHLELLRPYFDMYWSMLPTVKQWTNDVWELDGAQYQEKIPFDGVMGKWATERGPHPRVPTPRTVAHTNLILSSSAEIVMQFWWNYLYTGDETFLRDRVYPLMKEVVTFLVGYLEKDSRGFYSMDPSNAHESFWKVKNPTTDLAAIRYVFPIFIDVSQKLHLDSELRAACQERLDHLAPYPVSPDTGAIMPYELRPNEQMEWRNAENPDLFPIGVFPNILAGSPDYELGLKTFYHRKNVNGYGWTTDSIAAARLGLADALPDGESAKQSGLEWLLPLHANYYQNYPCGLQDYYGRKSGKHPYLEGSGTMSTGVGEMLLQSWNGVIRVCLALPKAWSADFKLLAMGGFEVTAHAEKGRVKLLQVLSQRGEPMAMMNPYIGAAVVSASGRQVLKATDRLLNFPTKIGEVYTVAPAEASSAVRRVSAERNERPKRLTPASPRWIGRQELASVVWNPPIEPDAPPPPIPVAKPQRPRNPEVYPVFFDSAPEIDADLSDLAWQGATPIGPFFLLGEESGAAEQMEVRIGYDGEALYLGITCWESKMDRVSAEYIAAAENRDADIFRDDSVEIFLQPTPGPYWHFAVNALGAIFDARGATAANDDSRINPNWQAAATRRSNRWTAEVAIPFNSIMPESPQANDAWGFNIGRNEKPHGELSTWAPLSERTFHLPNDFGRIVFSRGATQPPQAIANPDLVGHWTFDALKGVWAVDTSGHRNHGLLTAPMKQVEGKVGKALEFTGAGFVDIADADSLDLTEGMTLALWVCPKRKDSMRLIDKGPAGGADGYLLDTHPENNLRVITRIATHQVKETLPVNEWSHVAVTMGAGTLRVYMNGKLVSEANVPAKPLTVTGLPLRLGADSDGGSRFAGLMDDVRVYRKCLSAEEIASLLSP
ncbi:MAG: hypothetical protein AUJ92_11285 [Armatimonadetes bacterium CG2_30_59_28]|nr:hypothetical protein [Armatimonadota bacterium]OIO93936.1 MAG: hypothetical protein AUJ92_11285 [Armatimonadetes bacterium CG2_30_59_28]